MRETKLLSAVLLAGLSAATLLTQCKPDAGSTPIKHRPTATGLMYAENPKGNLDSIYGNIISALEANKAIGIVAQVNHQENAATAGMELNPTRVVLFGNPKLGTPLMQANQQAGLDLPQHMLVYKNDLGDVYTAFNATAYLASRYGISSVSTLPKIEQALTGLVKQATGQEVAATDKQTVALHEGIVEVESANSFADTYDKLRAAISGLDQVKIIAELDHQQNAQSVGLTLPPTKLIVFGNPALGTPLLQAQQTIGIDLPQKILVYEDPSGNVKLIYNDPHYLAERHGISGQQDLLDKIATALSNLAKAATE
ncbi:DUF302 domain-containing protein [Pontibacter sp. CAU 1760]